MVNKICLFIPLAVILALVVPTDAGERRCKLGHTDGSALDCERCRGSSEVGGVKDYARFDNKKAAFAPNSRKQSSSHGRRSRKRPLRCNGTTRKQNCTLASIEVLRFAWEVAVCRCSERLSSSVRWPVGHETPFGSSL